jgi:hypothetical protein
MTSIEALYEVRQELDNEYKTALQRRDQYRAGGDGLQAFGYDMMATGIEKAIMKLDGAIRREGKSLREE